MIFIKIWCIYWNSWKHFSSSNMNSSDYKVNILCPSLGITNKTCFYRFKPTSSCFLLTKIQSHTKLQQENRACYCSRKTSVCFPTRRVCFRFNFPIENIDLIMEPWHCKHRKGHFAKFLKYKMSFTEEWMLRATSANHSLIISTLYKCTSIKTFLRIKMLRWKSNLSSRKIPTTNFLIYFIAYWLSLWWIEISQG